MNIIKRKNEIVVDFSNGEASSHVTGSAIYITTKDINILLECGLAQSNNLKKDYYTNKERFNFKIKDLDFLVLCHAHLDHVGRAPLLFARGAQCQVIVPKGNLRLLKDIYEDCVKILDKEAQTLSRQLGKSIEPLYTKEDVDQLLSNVVELDFNERIYLNDFLTLRYTDSGHILSAAQVELWITSGNTTKLIAYTSDLGNTKIPKDYVRPFKPIEKANLLIGESTYGDRARPIATLSKRQKDLQKMREIINNTCIESKAKVLIPVFALDRAQLMLTILYDMFHEDPTFNIPIILDTPLGLKHFKTYLNNLPHEQKQKLADALMWRNVIQVGEWTESRYWAGADVPCIILASSGMLQNGRVLTYLPYILPNWRHFILFCGFLSENSIGWKIKNEPLAYIKINGESYKNRCNIVSLNTFSSHMQYDDLLNYYSDVNADKIALVHGEMSTKLNFGKDLEEILSKKHKTTKITIVNKGTKIHL